MRHTFTGKAKRWFVIGGLLLLMCTSSVSYVQAAALLNEAEINSLTYMREEEKLARDVYVYLHDKWGSRIFDNISVSEQTHMDAIKTLLDRYGIPDPVKDDTPGAFSDVFAGLYETLTDAGGVSLVEALKVGMFIEMTDIDDLNKGMITTDRRDIDKVYSNLLQGSLNHWDAFCSNLKKLKGDCAPYVLPVQ